MFGVRRQDATGGAPALHREDAQHRALIRPQVRSDHRSDTVRSLRIWLTGAAVEDGPLFRTVTKGGTLRGRIDPGDVARIFRGLARRAGVDPAGISGHSTRVGAAQDMIAHGLEIGEVMQAGGWKTPVMVARYTERLTARRGAAAKLAMLQQRVSAARPA